MILPKESMIRKHCDPFGLKHAIHFHLLFPLVVT